MTWRTWLVGFNGEVTEDVRIHDDDAREQTWGWERLVDLPDLKVDVWIREPPRFADPIQFWIAKKERP